MHGEPSPRSGRGCNDPTTDEDASTEAAVLRLVLEVHPIQLTIPELVRVMCRSVEDFGESDAVERAVRDLVGAGLLHCQGGFIFPTLAAFHFGDLPLD